ncbi:hypothetical protein OZX74_02535 [Bifidobacterium sp. ESL0798]|uniref:hypothetical protein n=1 Tax=Bifidobacterium sp. ESL0798 TaxID=2983235 RepID=UPI0023F725D8|nr:hypothetical protein [Bifidobacterium sp. ESL0798]WEV74437.1 hypothetical protein OZX74_02535 [Bifidobacterium sp. ESL0798]
MAKRKIRNAIKRHKVVSTAIGIPLVAIVLVVVVVLGQFIQQRVIDPVYYPYQEKRFSETVDLKENESAVAVDVSSSSPDVTVTVLSGDGSNVGSFRGVKKVFRTTTNGRYTIVVKNDTDHWVHADVGYWGVACVC